jgi:hypothetical protein
MVRTVTNEMAFAPGFAMPGLEGSAMTAAAMWRPNAPAINSAVLNQLHTQKQYVVTTPDAGRGNKGTSPWGFPV